MNGHVHKKQFIHCDAFRQKEMRIPVALIGFGGHARHIIDAFAECKTHRAHIAFDDSVPCGTELMGVKCAGNVNDVKTAVENFKFHCTVGHNQTRKRIVQELQTEFPTLQWTSCVHPSAAVSKFATIDRRGVFVGAGATVTAGAEIGAFTIINDGSNITHDVCIGLFSHAAPGCVILGGAVIGDETMVGANSTILPKVRIGNNVVVGANSTVTRDVPDNQTVVGSPAKVIERKI